MKHYSARGSEISDINANHLDWQVHISTGPNRPNSLVARPPKEGVTQTKVRMKFLFILKCGKTHNFGPRYTWSWKFRFWFCWKFHEKLNPVVTEKLLSKLQPSTVTKWHCGDLGPFSQDLSQIRDGVMIQNQVGAGLAPFGNFWKSEIGATCPLRVSATQNHKKSSYILLFGVPVPGYQTLRYCKIKARRLERTEIKSWMTELMDANKSPISGAQI